MSQALGTGLGLAQPGFGPGPGFWFKNVVNSDKKSNIFKLIN